MYYFPQSDLLYDPLQNASFSFEQPATEDGTRLIGRLVPAVNDSADFTASLAIQTQIGIDVANGARYAFWRYDGILHRAGLAKQFVTTTIENSESLLLQFAGLEQSLGTDGWQMGVPLEKNPRKRQGLIAKLAENVAIRALLTSTLPLDIINKLADINATIAAAETKTVATVASAPVSAPAATKPSYEAMNKSMPDYDAVTRQDLRLPFKLRGAEEDTGREANVSVDNWHRNLGPYINQALNGTRAALLKTMLNELSVGVTATDATVFETRLLDIYRAAIVTDAVINDADSTIVQQLRSELLWAENIVGLYSSISPNAHFDDAYAISVAAIQAKIRQIAPSVSIDEQHIIKPPPTYCHQTIASVQETLLPANRAEALSVITGRGLSILGQDLFNIFVYNVLPDASSTVLPPQLDPANTNFLADYQHFLQYAQVKRFGQETALDDFKANYLANMSADAQAALLEEYNHVIDDLLIADGEGYERVNPESLADKLRVVADITTVMAKKPDAITNADIKILDEYAYLLPSQQILAILQPRIAQIDLQTFTTVEQLYTSINIRPPRIKSQVMLYVVTTPAVLERLTQYVTDSAQLKELMCEVPAYARFRLLEQLGLDWVRNQLTDVNKLESLTRAIPQDKRLDFLTQQLGIGWVRDKIANISQLAPLIRVLPENAGLEFLQQLGIDWIRGKIANHAQLISLLNELGENVGLGCLQQLGLGWVQDQCMDSWQLADLIDRLPASARPVFLQQLSIDVIRNKIANGNQLVCFMHLALQPDKKLEFLQRLGIAFVKGKIDDNLQLMCLIGELEQDARLGFLRQLGISWVRGKLADLAQLEQLLSALPGQAGLDFLQLVGIDWMNRHYTGTNPQDAIGQLPDNTSINPSNAMLNSAMGPLMRHLYSSVGSHAPTTAASTQSTATDNTEFDNRHRSRHRRAAPSPHTG